MGHLAENGFNVETKPTNNLVGIKQEYNVPMQLQSCHTAVIDGYVIEGHVPAENIYRLLEERPDIIGLAVPGMPIGSPGMETEGMADEAYDVIAFSDEGTAVYARYP